MTPLEMTPTPDLIKELAKRFDHMVFSGVIERMRGDQDESLRYRRISGCRYVAQALASSLMIHAHEELLARAEPATEDDL